MNNQISNPILIKLNRSLSFYQLLGFNLLLILITIYSIREGQMMIYSIPFSVLLFSPFLTVSSFGILPREKNILKLKKAIKIGMIFLIIPSLPLSLFYEEGGVIIAGICLTIGLTVYYFRKRLEKQLLIINIIGGLLLTGIILLYLYYGI